MWEPEPPSGIVPHRRWFCEGGAFRFYLLHLSDSSRLQNKLWGFAEAAEIFGDGVLIAGRHRDWVGATNLAGLVTELSLHLQFEIVHLGEDLVVNLFEQRRIAGETLGIETLHFLDQTLQLALFFGIVLEGAEKLIQVADALAIGQLGIGRELGTVWRSSGPGQIRIVSSIDPPISTTVAAVSLFAIVIAIIAIAARIGAAVAVQAGAERAAASGLSLLRLLPTSLLAALLSALLTALLSAALAVAS